MLPLYAPLAKLDKAVGFYPTTMGSSPVRSAIRDEKVIVSLYGNVPIKGYPRNRFMLLLA